MNNSKISLVSIVIPVYNGEKFILECLDSAYKQTYTNIEIIVIDDGSTDKSLAIAENYPGEKKIVRQKNGDVSMARNSGVKNSLGQYIAFLDQDDQWMPDKIEKQIEVFNKNSQIDLVFTDLIKFFPSGKKHHAKDKHKIALSLNDKNLFEKLVWKNVLMPSAVMIKKESFIKAGMFDPSFKTCGDYEMWLRMAAMKMKFQYLPEPLTLYRQHEKNESKKIEVMHNDRLKVMQKLFSDISLEPEFEKLENLGLASVYMEGAHTFFSNKEYNKFYDNALKAFSYHKRVVNFKFISRLIRSHFLKDKKYI